MSKKKTTTTNTHAYMTPTDTADTKAYRDSIASMNTPDPSIKFNYANMRNNLNNRIDNPFGHNYSPEVSEAIKYSGNQELDQSQGQAYRQDAYQRKMAQTGAYGNLAGLTAPQLVQTGGTQTQSGGLLGQILGGAVGLGSAALGNPALM